MLWSLFGGLAVTIYPGTAFSRYVGINLQSMIHHGIQVVIGILLASRSADRMNLGFFLSGFLLFNIYSSVALSYNVIAHNILKLTREPDGINMFFLSPYHETSIPALQTIRDHTSYAFMLFVYMASFTVIVLLMYHIEMMIFKRKNTKTHIRNRFYDKIRVHWSIFNT